MFPFVLSHPYSSPFVSIHQRKTRTSFCPSAIPPHMHFSQTVLQFPKMRILILCLFVSFLSLKILQLLCKTVQVKCQSSKKVVKGFLIALKENNPPWFALYFCKQGEWMLLKTGIICVRQLIFQSASVRSKIKKKKGSGVNPVKVMTLPLLQQAIPRMISFRLFCRSFIS